jgi:hypothetical protein
VTPSARDERRWTLYRYGPTWFVAGVVEPMAAESVEVIPVAEAEAAMWEMHQRALHAEAALAAARQADEAMVERAANSLQDALEFGSPASSYEHAARAALLAALTVPEPEGKR